MTNDRPPATPDPDPGMSPNRQRLDAVLRLFERIAFCCLSALVVIWVADRMRGVDFDPISVIPCDGAACVPYAGPEAGRPWSVYTGALDTAVITSFSNQNMCAALAETLSLRGPQGRGVDLVIDLMTSRGTVVLTEAAAPGLPWTIAPGLRNDDFWDVARDALSLNATRGCFPMQYKPVFWPLWLLWMLVVFARFSRWRLGASSVTPAP